MTLLHILISALIFIPLKIFEQKLMSAAMAMDQGRERGSSESPTTKSPNLPYVLSTHGYPSQHPGYPAFQPTFPGMPPPPHVPPGEMRHHPGYPPPPPGYVYPAYPYPVPTPAAAAAAVRQAAPTPPSHRRGHSTISAGSTSSHSGDHRSHPVKEDMDGTDDALVDDSAKSAPS